MTTLKSIELTCPVCEEKIHSQAILSTNSFGGKRTDFHERAAGTQPLPYFVHVCSYCGYAGSEISFERDAQDLGTLEKDQIRELMAPFISPNRVLNGSDKYEMAARVATVTGSSDYRWIADLYLRAAWCCVDEGDTEAERFFRRKSADYFELALDDFGAVPDADRAVLTYLTGELWRRIGDKAKAAEWFDKVESEVIDRSTQQWIIDAARQQRDAPREWFG